MKFIAKQKRFAAALIAALVFTTTIVRAAEPITPEAAHAIAVDAYIYF
jgi:hypothetical protein